MATNSLTQAHSPIPWSAICDAASLESKHPLKSVIEAVNSANTAVASSGSNLHVAHAGHVARHVGRYASRAALATNAADIKTITETIRLGDVREEASNLMPTMSANDPAALFTTGTSHHSVFATLGSDRIKVYENHAAPPIVPIISIPIVPIIFIAVMIGLIITGILMGFLARWLRKRRLLSRLHASRQDKRSGTTREGRNADVPSPAASLSSGTTITPARATGCQRLPTGGEAVV